MTYSSEILSCYNNGRVSGICFSNDFSLELMNTVMQSVCNYYVVGGLVSYVCLFQQRWVSHHLLRLGSAWHFFFFSAESSRIIHQELDGTLGAIISSFPPTAGIFFYHNAIQRCLSCKSRKKWILRGNQERAHMHTHIWKAFRKQYLPYHIQYIRMV